MTWKIIDFLHFIIYLITIGVISQREIQFRHYNKLINYNINGVVVRANKLPNYN